MELGLAYDNLQLPGQVGQMIGRIARAWTVACCAHVLQSPVITYVANLSSQLDWKSCIIVTTSGVACYITHNALALSHSHQGLTYYIFPHDLYTLWWMWLLTYLRIKGTRTRLLVLTYIAPSPNRFELGKAITGLECIAADGCQIGPILIFAMKSFNN